MIWRALPFLKNVDGPEQSLKLYHDKYIYDIPQSYNPHQNDNNWHIIIPIKKYVILLIVILDIW